MEAEQMPPEQRFEAGRRRGEQYRTPEELQGAVAQFAEGQGQVRISDIVNEFGVRKFKAQKLLQELQRQGRLSEPDKSGFREYREAPAAEAPVAPERPAEAPRSLKLRQSQ
jgi:hypothetical protein